MSSISNSISINKKSKRDSIEKLIRVNYFSFNIKRNFNKAYKMYLDSHEKIKKPKTVIDVENKDKQTINNVTKSKKNFIIRLLLIIILIVIISIGLALFLYLKKWKKEIQQTPEAYIIKSNGGTINTEELTFDSFQKKLDEEKKNSITAVYSTQKNEESLFFNPDKI